MRLINQEGKQLGIFNLREAVEKARSAGLDLILITRKVSPPICKIMDYGKYAYNLDKKEKKQRQKAGELKSIRLTFNISPHDMETRAKTALKFLKEGDKIKIEMRLRGRQKALGNFARDKIAKFLESLKQEVPLKVERPLKREARGFTMIITRSVGG